MIGLIRQTDLRPTTTHKKLLTSENTHPQWLTYDLSQALCYINSVMDYWSTEHVSHTLSKVSNNRLANRFPVGHRTSNVNLNYVRTTFDLDFWESRVADWSYIVSRHIPLADKLIVNIELFELLRLFNWICNFFRPLPRSSVEIAEIIIPVIQFLHVYGCDIGACRNLNAVCVWRHMIIVYNARMWAWSSYTLSNSPDVITRHLSWTLVAVGNHSSKR